MARIVVESQENGPYLVIVDGKPLASLCRCGLSSRKPLCDRTHERSGFTAPGAPVMKAESPVTLAPVVKPELPASVASVMKAEPLVSVVAPPSELGRTTASPAERRNECKSCGHVNPEWIRTYCVRCAAKLKMD